MKDMESTESDERFAKVCSDPPVVIRRKRKGKNRAHLKRKRSSLILEPLFEHVSEFVKDAVSMDATEEKNFKKGSKSEILLQKIEVSLKKLVQVGQGIALDYPEVRKDMLIASKNVMDSGKLIYDYKHFIQKSSFVKKIDRSLKILA